MKMLALVAFAVVPLLPGCAALDAPTGTGPAQEKVVFLKPGTRADVAFVVKNVGDVSGQLFLNSRENYLDPQCVTVAVRPEVLSKLKARYGDNLETALLGKKVHVSGKVEQVDVPSPVPRLLSNPITYRTQVMLSADQIEVI